MHSRWLGYNLAIVPLDSFRRARKSEREREKERSERGGSGGCHDIPTKYRMSGLTWREHNADIQTHRGTTSASNKPSVVWLFAVPSFFTTSSIHCSLLERTFQVALMASFSSSAACENIWIWILMEEEVSDGNACCRNRLQQVVTWSIRLMGKMSLRLGCSSLAHERSYVYFYV